MKIGDLVRHKLTVNDSSTVVDIKDDMILVRSKYLSIGP